MEREKKAYMIIIGILFIAATFAIALKENIENFIAGSIILAILTTYFWATIGHIRIGLYCALVVCIIALFFCAYSCVRNKSTVKQYVLTPGLLAFIVLSFAVIALNIGVDAAESPDSPYWVRIVKGICYYDDYWKGVYANSHPQSIAIWGYLSIKTWKEWSDTLLVASNDMYMLSILLPLFACLGEKDPGKSKTRLLSNIVLTAVVFIVPQISDANEYAIYASDMIMALLIGMGIVLFAKAASEKKDVFYVLALLYFSAAVLTKRVAIVIVAMVFVWLFFILLEEKRVKLILLYLIVPTLSYVIFDRNSYAIFIILALFGALVLNKLLKVKNKKLLIIPGALVAFGVAVAITFVLKRAAQKYYYFDQKEVALAYFKMLFLADKDTYYVGRIFHMPLMLFVLISIVIFASIAVKHINFFDKYEQILTIGIFVTIFLYVAMFFYLYITQIASASGVIYRNSLLGINRYMKVIPIFISCFGIYVLISRFSSYKIMAILMLVLFLFCDMFSVASLAFERPKQVEFTGIEMLKENLGEDEEIAYVDMGISNHRGSFLLQMFPHKYRNIDELSYDYRNANGGELIDLEKLTELLEGCDYLYIYKADDVFTEKYSDLFYNQEDIKLNDALYYRNAENGLFILQ